MLQPPRLVLEPLFLAGDQARRVDLLRDVPQVVRAPFGF